MKRNQSKQLVRAVLASCALGTTFSASLAQADTTFTTSWNAPLYGGDWSDPTNWTAGEPKNDPAAGLFYDADISITPNTIGYVVTYNDNLSVNSIYIGPPSPPATTDAGGTLAIGGGTLSLVHDGIALDNQGNVNQTGGALNIQASNVISMLAGNSSYNISGGTATFSTPITKNFLTLGGNTGDAVTMRVSGTGVVNGWIMSVGLNSGTGTVIQSGGTVALSGALNALSIGEGSSAFTSAGTYALSGGQLSASNEYIGAATTGSFIQTGGTNLIPVGTTNSVAIGEDSSANGTYSISGGTLDTSAIVDAHFGSGTFLQSGGTVNDRGVLRVARDLGSKAYFAVSAGTATFGGEADVGYGGNGSFSETGGSVSVPAGLFIGKNAASVGKYSITGGNLNGATLSIGSAGSGTFVQSGGTSILLAPTIIGNGTLIISAGSFANASTVNNGTILIGGTANAAIGALSGTGLSSVTNTAVVGTTSIKQATFRAAGSASVSVATNGTPSGLSQIGTLSIGNSAVVDLNDNDLIVSSITPKTIIEGYVRTARDNGYWDKPGLTSTAAKPTGTSLKPFGLGILSGTEYMSVTPANTSFDGVAISSTDTLVKFTYNGDADFNGFINANDYAYIDSGYQNQNNAGFVFDWFHGDFDYSGKIDANDYALIDSAYQLQSGTLRNAIDYLETGTLPTGTISGSLQEVINHENEFGAAYANDFIFANVPEPSSVIVGVTMLWLHSHRRRRSGKPVLVKPTLAKSPLSFLIQGRWGNGEASRMHVQLAREDLHAVGNRPHSPDSRNK